MVTHNVFEFARKIKRKIPIVSGIRLRKKVFDPNLALYGGRPVSDYLLPTEPYRFENRDSERVRDVVSSGLLTHGSGKEIISLEKEFAEYIRTKYSIATNSCTSALMLACKAIGIKPGDEVIVPGYTFVATAQAVLTCGGIPVFADIDETFNISADSAEEKITSKTKAIIVVHMFGNLASLPELLQIAKKHNLNVIEDCAQAIGATFKNKKVGSFGNIGCYSFNENKALPTGQGGMLVTSNKKFYEIAETTRNTGVFFGEKTDVKTTGGTYYMTEMEAALARNILSKLPLLNKKRVENFEILKKYLVEIGDFAEAYRIINNAQPSFSRLAFILNFKKLKMGRDFFLRAVNAEGIPLKTLYPTPLYKYLLFKNKKDLLTNNSFPFSLNKKLNYTTLPFVEKFCENQVVMEFSPYLTKEDIFSLIKAVRKVAYHSKNNKFHFLDKSLSPKNEGEIKLGIIGLGGISDVHIKALMNNPKVSIEALSEINKEALNEKSRYLKIKKAYMDYKRILDDPSINVVDILLPHHLHYQTIIDSLYARKVVICEKPLVTSLSELKKVMKASEKTGKEVYVKHYMRYATLHNDLKDIILGNSLGRLYLVNCLFTVDSVISFLNPKSWKTNIKEGGGGVLMDNGIHIIDLLIHFLGKPISVYSTCKKNITQQVKKGEDVAITTLEFKNNIVANIVCTATDTSFGFRWEKNFFTTNGQVTLEDLGKEKMVLTIVKDNKITFQKKEENWWEKANVSALNDIVERIYNDTPPSINFSEISSGLEVVLNAYKSSFNGRKYSLK